MNLRPALLIFALLPSCAFRPASEAVTLSPLVFPWSPRPAPKTQVRLKTDAAYFLFEFDVEDSDLVIAKEWTGESTLDAEDRVEIFFAADAALHHYYCIEIDPLGRVHDYAASHYRKFESAWNCPGLKTTAKRTTTGYEVSGSLPLETLSALCGRPVVGGTELWVGLFRADFYGATRGEAAENWLSWVRPTTKTPDFHVPSAFRLLPLP